MFGVDGLAGLGAVLDGLVDADADAFADRESIKVLHRQLARLEAVTARASASFAASGEWGLDGARSASAWISGSCRLPKHVADSQVRLGRAMRVLPVTAEAWLAGEVSSSHVAALSAARRSGVEDDLARDEANLVGFAKRLSFKQFQQVVAYWSQAAAPDEADLDAEALEAKRRCNVSSTLGGMVRGDFDLDPIRGAIVDETMREIYDELFKADWAAARERLGREPTVEELGRTPQQRRADALVEMAIRARTVPAGGRRPRPLFSVYVDYESTMKRLCELANGTVIAPGQLVPWLSDADLERVVFGPKGRVIDVGRRSRFFTGALRRAVQLRDRECFHPLCDQPAEQCQVDHQQEFFEGGETTQGNGQPACGFHNRWKHKNKRGDPATRSGSKPGRKRKRRSDSQQGSSDAGSSSADGDSAPRPDA